MGVFPANHVWLWEKCNCKINNKQTTNQPNKETPFPSGCGNDSDNPDPIMIHGYGLNHLNIRYTLQHGAHKK